MSNTELSQSFFGSWGKPQLLEKEGSCSLKD